MMAGRFTWGNALALVVAVLLGWIAGGGGGARAHDDDDDDCRYEIYQPQRDNAPVILLNQCRGTAWTLSNDGRTWQSVR